MHNWVLFLAHHTVMEHNGNLSEHMQNKFILYLVSLWSAKETLFTVLRFLCAFFVHTPKQDTPTLKNCSSLYLV